MPPSGRRRCREKKVEVGMFTKIQRHRGNSSYRRSSQRHSSTDTNTHKGNVWNIMECRAVKRTGTAMAPKLNVHLKK